MALANSSIKISPRSIEANKVNEDALRSLHTPKDTKTLTHGKVFQSSLGRDDPASKQVVPGGLVNICLAAYNGHHKLVLRPEDVWAAIQTQFAFYVSKNAENLRDVFVSHEGKQELEVTDGEVLSKDVGVMAQMMVAKMRAHLKDESVVEWILPSFSTTCDKDLAVFSIMAMGTMKHYFSYKMSFMCGLPEVTLLGTVQDWEAIRTRVQRLPEFDCTKDKLLSTWTEMLAEVVDKFVETVGGSADLDWWNSMVSPFEVDLVCATEPGVSGWLTVFNVFNSKGDWIAPRKFQAGKYPKISEKDIEVGYVSCPVLVDDNGTEVNTQLYGGMFGADVSEENTLVPQLNWIMYTMK
eukprot:TRINITY_DN6729_c0_g1_i1.p1 TRINITY_DN6729_c0_g1~~TRINITY_DN6729_c0_g1_i1.p1  ORF type:complete len:352 (+),score=75.37 TRINITY_DN6729_c0_g1_i1:68-1123(+)